MTVAGAASLLDSVFTPGSVQRTTLANGLRVIVRRDTSAPVVAIVTYVKAGYFDETDDIVGIAHVLEHMYFKGTPSRGVGQIAKQTKASGGYLNAGTIYDHTHYYAVLPASGFAAGLAVQADAYANSLIDAGELSRELEVIIEEAKRKLDNPTAYATESLFNLLHDRHRIRRWRIGTEDGLRQLTSADVSRFYRNYYRPSNTVLTIVGDVDPEQTLALVERHYGGITDATPTRTPGLGERTATNPDFRYREMSGDVNQAELVFGWRTPSLLHEDTPALDLLAAVLSGGRASRLYRAVRERRLASSITAYNYTPTDLGVFVVHATARPERARSAARGAWDQLLRVQAGEVTAAETERARRVLEASWLRRFESMEGQANHLASWELLGDWQAGSRYVEALLATTAEQVGAVAARYLAPAHGALVVYRPAGAAPLAADGAAMRASLDAERPEALEIPARTTLPSSVPGSRAWARDGVEASVHKFRTANGVPILVQRRAGAIAHLGWFARGGAPDESEAESGITTLMTRTALKGTQRRSAQRIAEDAEYLGSVLSGAASSDHLQWTVSVPARRLDEAAELLADVVQRPLFADDALESERAVALADIASVRDDMYRWPMRLATDAAWADHPYGRSVLGSEQSLPRITGTSLHEWHRRHALESPGAIVCVGDIDPEEAAALAARCFGALRVAADREIAVPAWTPTTLVRTDARDKAQSALALLFDGPKRGDDSRFAAAMIAGVASGLGGRFFDELRERQSLAYTVMASPIARRRAGAFAAYIAMSPEKEDAARVGLLREFARLCEAPVSDAELTAAQTYALGIHAIRRESGASVMGDIAESFLLGTSLRELDEVEACVRGVTAAGMLALAKRYFDPDRRVEGVVRGVGKSV